MKENFKPFFFIKIFVFTLLIWIYHYKNNCICGKSIDIKNKLDKYSSLRTNRLLSESSLDVISTGYGSGDKGYYNIMNEKADTYKTDKNSKSRKNIIKEILLKAEERNNLFKKRKYSSFNILDLFLEKDIFNELDSVDKINYNKKIDKQTASLMKRRKTSLGYSLYYNKTENFKINKEGNLKIYYNIFNSTNKKNIQYGIK
ncbi:hypothetical protein MKS88_000614 [Plasmodium brasilianum]|uniref:Uncharacterized protein n=2 Tax=Plasmodium brasilianum TaxID=5824 RepID=A0ACB9Y6W3_PLABR|nr:hypothetical protein MKS88_003488 [Plasmodium brasilianum]KAI4841373.1 hypothetical protein MKS88_000614 [Plasmodium brasilianum]